MYNCQLLTVIYFHKTLHLRYSKTFYIRHGRLRKAPTSAKLLSVILQAQIEYISLAGNFFFRALKLASSFRINDLSIKKRLP